MNKRLATLFGFLTTFFTDRRITNIYIVLLILLCLIPAIIIAVWYGDWGLDFTLDYIGVELTPSLNREYCIIMRRSSSHT